MTPKKNLTFAVLYNPNKSFWDSWRKCVFEVYEEKGRQLAPADIREKEYIELAKKYFSIHLIETEKQRKLDIQYDGIDAKRDKQIRGIIDFYARALKDDKVVLASWARNAGVEQGSLFSNKINDELAFGISRTFADGLNILMGEITPEIAMQNYKHVGAFTGKNEKRELKLRPVDIDEITAEQFYSRLEKIKNAKVLQTLLSLWAFSNTQGNFTFSGTRLTTVMQTILGTKRVFNQPEKRAFTKAIHILRGFEIYLDTPLEKKDRKTRYIKEKDGKTKKIIKTNDVKREYYRILDLQGAVYATRKKDVLNENGEVIFKKGDVDETVIKQIYGELLPRFNKGIMRGRMYSRGLLELDANKDEKAILLGFKLLTRFDQLRMGAKGQDLVADDNLYIKTDRKNLIKWTGYEKTDEGNKNDASKILMRTLDKLVEINCLRKYEPYEISTKDDEQIFLYPHPIAIKKELLESGKKE